MKRLLPVFIAITFLLGFPHVFAGAGWTQELQNLMIKQGWLVPSNHLGHPRCSVTSPTKEQTELLVSSICNEWGSDYPTPNDCRLTVLNVVDSYTRISCQKDGTEVKTLSDGTKAAFRSGKGWYEDDFVALGIEKEIIAKHDDTYCFLRQPNEVDLYAFNKLCPSESDKSSFAVLCNEEKTKFLAFEGIKSCSDSSTSIAPVTDAQSVKSLSIWERFSDYINSIISRLLNK